MRLHCLPHPSLSSQALVTSPTEVRSFLEGELKLALSAEKDQVVTGFIRVARTYHPGDADHRRRHQVKGWLPCREIIGIRNDGCMHA